MGGYMNEETSPSRRWWVIIVGLVCGCIIWAMSVSVTGKVEAFDTLGYYIPCMLFAGAVSTIFGPKYWFTAVISIFMGERLYIALLPSDIGGLGMAFYSGVMGIFILTWLPAMVGALFVVYLTRMVTKMSR